MAKNTLPSLDKNITVCFTGHRPNKLAGYEEAPYNAFVGDMAEVIEDLYSQGFRNFVTGLAQGVDQLVFWAVMRVKKRHADINNIVFMPFHGQESRWAKKGLFSQDDYGKILRHADMVFTCSDECPAQFHDAARLLMERNETMCDVSSLCAAICWSDNWRKDKGGTAACMRYQYGKDRNAIVQYKPYTQADGTLRLSVTGVKAPEL